MIENARPDLCLAVIRPSIITDIIWRYIMAQRIKTIQTRVYEEEYNLIDQRANSLGLSISDYLRLVVLAAKVEVTVEPIQRKDEE